LTTFEMPTIKNFGKGVAFGILSSLIIEMTFIPALRSILPAPTEKQAVKEQSRTFFDPFLYWLAKLIRGGRDSWIIPAFAGLLVVAIIGAMRMQVNNSTESQFFAGIDLWERLQRASFTPLGLVDSIYRSGSTSIGTMDIFVRVESKQPEGIKDPDVLRRIERVEDFIKEHSAELSVNYVVSIVDYFKLMNRAMNENDPKAEVLPNTREAVAQFLFFASMSGPGGDTERYVDFDYQRAIVHIFLKNDDNKKVAHFIKTVQSEIDQAFKGSSAKAEVGGGIAYLLAINETIVRDKVLNMIQITAIIFVVAALLLRSLVGALIVLVPLITSIVMNFGLMGWTNIWLSMGTATFSSIAAGIGADYAIYFIFRMREEVRRTGSKREAAAITLTTSGKAIVSVALAIATGYLCLPLSGWKLGFLMGTLVALMMVSSCLGAVALMPAILVRVNARFLGGDRPQASSSLKPDNGKSTKFVKREEPVQRPDSEAFADRGSSSNRRQPRDL